MFPDNNCIHEQQQKYTQKNTPRRKFKSIRIIYNDFFFYASM